MRRGVFIALAALALAALALAACDQARSVPPDSANWRAIEVTAAPVELDPDHPAPTRVGALVFRGGVELRSRDAAFGGLSGLWVGPDGRLVAVSDAGFWLSARLISNAETGAPLELRDVRVATFRDERGAELIEGVDKDAEGLARLADGRFAVSFEHTHLVRFYDLDGAGVAAPSVTGPRLVGVERLEPNASLEAIADAGAGRVLVGAERSDGPRTPLWSASIASSAPAPRTGELDLPFGYGLVSLDRLPDGNFIAVQRFYAPVVGVRIRIVRITAASVGDGRARVTMLAELGADFELDNFESVAVTPLPDGGARLHLISDNNFSPAQRTLLYVFDLPAS